MIESFIFRQGPDAPNNQDLPVLLYRGVLDMAGRDDPAAGFEHAFRAQGWKGLWRDGIYDYRHYHSNAHEVLGVARGAAAVEIGGRDGRVLELAAGDMIVLPAGTAHRCVRADADFLVVGAYPPGQTDWDICRSLSDCPDFKARIARVPLPPADPFYGPGGPLDAAWLHGDKEDGHREGKRREVVRDPAGRAEGAGPRS